MRVHITIEYRHQHLPTTSHIECDFSCIQEMLNLSHSMDGYGNDLISWYIYPLQESNEK